MPNQRLHVDVAIVGAGMVGLTLANQLSNQGISLAIIDQNNPPKFDSNQPYNARVTAVSPGSQAIFEHAHVWTPIQNKRVTPYDTMVVWDEAGKAKIHFSSHDINYPRLGSIVENVVIQSSLYEVIQQQADISWFIPAEIENVVVCEDHIKITLNSDQTIIAKLLVGADGLQSSVRKFSKIEFSKKLYQQNGIIARVRTEYTHQNTAWQRFLSTGPLALLPLNNGECSIVWSANDDYANELMQLGEYGFSKALTQASDLQLGDITLCSERAIFPLISGQAEAMVKQRIALVGDAAHTLHPLAGQGANLGFTDAAVLADVLTHAERDIGSYKVLRKYERARVGERQIMQRAMDIFVTAFGSTTAPAIIARNFALNTADRIQPVKKFFMKHAMGLNKDRPVFAR